MKKLNWYYIFFWGVAFFIEYLTLKGISYVFSFENINWSHVSFLISLLFVPSILAVQFLAGHSGKLYPLQLKLNSRERIIRVNQAYHIQGFLLVEGVLYETSTRIVFLVPQGQKGFQISKQSILKLHSRGKSIWARMVFRHLLWVETKDKETNDEHFVIITELSQNPSAFEFSNKLNIATDYPSVYNYERKIKQKDILKE
ncbi:MAG: hypothetical protein MI784_16885 [Cytophagales bacterium]|nr:hypothetical protein [Cytophagales bacterium]